jgi:hypothetical protein
MTVKVGAVAISLLAVVALVGPGPAEARVTLFSAPVTFHPEDTVVCAVANISERTLGGPGQAGVSGVLMRVDGTSFSSFGCETVAPRTVCKNTVAGTETPGGGLPVLLYCRVNVNGIGRNGVRASLCNETTGACVDLR